MKKFIQTWPKHYWFLYLLIGALLYTPAPVQAQKKERTRLKAYYEKLSNNDKKISIILTQGRGKSMKGVPYADIKLTTSNEDSTATMGTIQTDSLGEAELFIEANYPFLENEDGYLNFKANYRGNDSLRGSRKEVEFLDLNLEVTLDVEDSVKTVGVLAYEVDEEGNKQPVEELGMKVGVKRLLSNLYLEDIDTDEDGMAEMEFPNDIPGDSIGTITVVVRFEDHDDYGTMTKTMEVNWGTPVDYSDSSNQRSLFGDSAPWWMIISVAIILGGAWIHFLWAVFKVIKIRKLA